MKIRLLNKTEKEKTQKTKKIENISTKQENIDQSNMEKNIVHIFGFQKYTSLMKLRIAVGTIFFLCTISMIFIFFGGWLISAFLLLMGYILLFILLIELLRVKKL